FITPLTTEEIAFQTVVKAVLMPLRMPDRNEEIPPNTEVVVPSISPDFKPKKDAIPFQMPSKKLLIPVHTPEKNPEMAVHTVVATDWIPESTLEKKELIPFHTPSKKVLTEVHTVFQSVPNRPRNASAAPFSVFRTLLKVDFINSQMPTNICFTPSQAPCQSPVKIPMNTERRPEMVLRTTLSVTEISWNAPVNTGASTLQNPFQMAFSTSVMFWKSKPRALIFSTISWQKPWTVATIPFQISVMAVRNPSLVFHRVIKAAVSVPRTATTAMTGAEMPPRAAPSFPKMPLAPEMLVTRSLAPWASFTNPCMVEPVTEIISP